MKVAIVGVGGMGGVHFGIYKNLPDIEFVAACDIRIDMLKEKAEGVDINLYSDYEEMLRVEKPDIVDVCTPTYLHKEHTIMALKSGANVLCEKPMALNSSDASEMAKVAKEEGKLLMIAHVVRFMSPYRYLEKIIKTEKYGKLIKLHMDRISSTPRWSNENWMLDVKKSGLVGLDMMIHDVDFMQSMLGKPKNVFGTFYDMENLSNHLSAVYEYDKLSVAVETGWMKADYPFFAGFTAFFEEGYLELKDGKLFENKEEVDLKKDNQIGDTGINLSDVDGYYEEIVYFIDCVKNNKEPEFVMPESSIYTIKLIEETFEKTNKLN